MTESPFSDRLVRAVIKMLEEPMWSIISDNPDEIPDIYAASVVRALFKDRTDLWVRLQLVEGELAEVKSRLANVIDGVEMTVGDRIEIPLDDIVANPDLGPNESRYYE